VIITEGTFSLGPTGIHIPKRGPDGAPLSDVNLHFDARLAKLTYFGAGVAVAVDPGGVYSRTVVEIGDLQATGSAVDSATAVGVYWHNIYHGEGNIMVRDFRAGKGMVMDNVSNNHFEYLRFHNCKVGLFTENDASHTRIDYLSYRLEDEDRVRVSGGIGMQNIPGVGINQMGFAYSTIGNASFANYSKNPFTAIKFDHFDGEVVTILSLHLEDNTSGISHLADLNTDNNRGTLYIGHYAVAMLDDNGKIAVKGNSVNIRTLEHGGENLSPSFVFDPADTKYFATYNANQMIDTVNSRQATRSLKIERQAGHSGDIMIDCFKNQSFPAPGSGITYEFAVKANQTGILVSAQLASFNKLGGEQQSNMSPWFEITSANTWYLVAIPPDRFKVPTDTASGYLKLTIDKAGLNSTSMIYFSELSVFADEVKPPLIENSGTATIANGSSSVTFAHGLAVTPSVVVVTPQGDPGGGIWVSAKDGTNITVSRSGTSGDLPFYWRAEVK